MTRQGRNASRWWWRRQASTEETCEKKTSYIYIYIIYIHIEYNTIPYQSSIIDIISCVIHHKSYVTYHISHLICIYIYIHINYFRVPSKVASEAAVTPRAARASNAPAGPTRRWMWLSSSTGSVAENGWKLAKDAQSTRSADDSNGEADL